MTIETKDATRSTRRLNIGVIGVGVGGLDIIRSIVQQPETVNLAAGYTSWP